MNKYASLLEKISSYELIATARKVHGPYKKKDGRQIVIIVNDDGSRRTVSFPKFLVEENIGRPLDPDLETVDHWDFNFNNNDLNNLRIVPRAQHSADDTRRVKLIKLKCSMCNKDFERSPRLIRDKSKKGVRGEFCSRQCSGRYARALQLGRIKKFKKVPYVESEYYRRKHLASVMDLFIKKYGHIDT